MEPAVALTTDEELLWRSLLRLVITLPRTLDEDLVKGSGLSLTEYGTLMNLSEAPDGRLRMAELAGATALSASRITRVVDDLQKRSLVSKDRCEGDARGNIATITDQGLARLKSAYPVHLASARRRVIDLVDPPQLTALAATLHDIAAGER